MVLVGIMSKRKYNLQKLNLKYHWNFLRENISTPGLKLLP